MSDIKLFNKKTQENIKIAKQNFFDIQKIIEKNSVPLLGITVIASDISINGVPSEKIQTLGYDENFGIVIIEYRNGKFTSVIGKGLTQIDYIKKNMGKFRLFIKDLVSDEIFKNLIFETRLIVVGVDFNSYEQYSIKQVAYDIDLIKISFFSNDIIALEKIYTANKDSIINSQKITNEYFPRINEFALSLGDEVVAKGNSNFIIYRKIKTFMYIIFAEQLIIKVKLKDSYKDIIIKTKSDCEKAFKFIEQAYDEN